MRLIARRNPWHYRTTLDGGVGFCIWALQQAGLQVPPFDHHPLGDNSLRVAGLTPTSWQAWFLSVLHLNRQLDEYAAHGKGFPPREISERAYHSYQAWPGDAVVAALLAEQWEGYRAASSERKRQRISDAGNLRLAPQAYRQWWRQLTTIGAGLPFLSVYLVDYPTLAIYALRPATLVIGARMEMLDSEASAEAILRGVAHLVTLARG